MQTKYFIAKETKRRVSASTGLKTLVRETLRSLIASCGQGIALRGTAGLAHYRVIDLTQCEAHHPRAVQQGISGRVREM